MKKGLLYLALTIALLNACDTVSPPVYGCTDELAINYNPSANLDDESCLIIGCMDENAFNFNASANIACDTTNTSDDCCCYTNFSCFEDPESISQKVLVEDFTGHKCQNCPEAAEELHNLQSVHGNNLIGVAIHAGYFAIPNASTAPYLTTDFRTEGGTIIHDFFAPEGYPVGMLNRTDYPNNHLKNHQNWGTSIYALMTQTPQLGICLNESCETINVSLLGLENIESPLKLVVCITEDHIVDWQTVEGKGNIADYEHNHVLRKIITNPMGDDIGSLSLNEEKSYSLSYTLEESWIKSNCNIVAYVYNENTKEILQVEEIHIN
ncbi:MAG: Omp28 family outer membrane lipoprotein [Rhodobacteraceae bacterium]|nr:Omp28 family outer membrane lipoprotein [Paracoccaceae bacterium]